MSEQDNGGGFFSGLVIGGLIGAAVGLLLAPRPGTETVRVIREKGTELRSKGEQIFTDDGHNFREIAEDVREIVREAVEEAREVIKDAVDQGREARDKATIELQHQFDQTRNGPPSTN